MVSAWGCEQRMVLGQIATDDKSNEITAVPKLLEMLSLKGTIVTTDALNCQRAIAQQIVDQGGDYALALKGNQATLHADVSLFLEETACTSTTTARTVDGDHGRVEIRTATVSTDISWLQDQHEWPGLAAVGKVERIRETADKTTRETAYYLLSTGFSSERFLEVVRSHWGVENRLRWRMDVVMNEDQPTQPLRSRAEQPRRVAAYGAERRAKGSDQGFTAWQAQTRLMGRKLPQDLARAVLTFRSAIALGEDTPLAILSNRRH